MREHYFARREYYLAKAKEENARYRQFVRELLAEWKAVPCADCKQVFPPWAMDFDHVSGKKLFNVSEAAKLGRKRLIEEAAKCEIVCANCHRQRTRSRLLSKFASVRSSGMLSETAKRRSRPAERNGYDRTVA